MSIEPLQNRISQLERLIEVGRNLGALVDLDPLLQTLINEAANLTYSEEASILLFNPVNDHLEFIAAPWFKRDKMREVLVPLKNSIAGQVFLHGEPVLVADAQEDKRRFRDVDEKTGFVTHSMMAVPLTFKGENIGVLTAVNKRGGGQYSKEDVFVLETLASQAAIAINNANLLRHAQQAYDDLNSLDKMKSDFIAITSHELRTPLGLILGHATFLQEMVPDELREQMEVIVRSSVRLKEIVEDLSKVNNFQTGQARVRWNEVSINSLLKEVVGNFKKDAEDKEITLILELPESELKVEGDSEKLGIAFIHIIRNAIMFTDKGEVKVSAARLPGYVRVEVSDTGIGIPEKDLTRVFERFYQVESHMTRRHGGMGLGLSVVKVMVEMHRGRISVSSQVNKGTSFTVLFPISSKENGARASFPLE